MSDANTKRCVILGGGGHARVVIDCLRVGRQATAHAVLDANQARWGTEVLGVPVQGGDDLLPRLAAEGVTHFVVGLGSVGDAGSRRRLFELGMREGLIPLTLHHPSTVCSPWATVGAGSVVLAVAVVNAGATLGANTIINTGAIVEHDCMLADHVHVATGARLCGDVRVGEGAHIGAGATVRQSLTIGEGAIVGAGAVVVRPVEPWTVVAGVPARVLDRRGQRRAEGSVPEVVT